MIVITLKHNNDQIYHKCFRQIYHENEHLLGLHVVNCVLTKSSYAAKANTRIAQFQEKLLFTDI